MKENDNQDIKLLVRLRGNTDIKQEKPITEEGDSKQSGKTGTKANKQQTPLQTKPNDKKDNKTKPIKNNSQQPATSNLNI